MSIFKACDIRAPYPDELKDEHAILLGKAIARLLGSCEILVAGDGRLSTPRLKGLLIDSFLASGCRVIDLGMIPTPVFYFARHELGVQAGVMVTASHNPPQYNGFKLAFGDLPITEEEIAGLQKLMSQSNAVLPETGQRLAGSIDILPTYIQFAKDQIAPLAGLRVVVDYGNGMGTLTGPELWNHSGAETIALFDEVDGRFPNRSPDPANPRNLTALQQAVREYRADLGVAYDGDADRVAFVDEQGRMANADKIIALFARHRLRDGAAAVVYDQKCSRLVPETIHAAGGEPIMEKSGHTFIKTTFLQKKAVYAGELSGHHFFRSLPQGDDGVLASLYFAEMLKNSGQTLSMVLQTLPDYPITPDIRLPVAAGEADRILAELKEGLTDKADLIFLDGIRAEFPDGWGLARKSVTEPLITLRFEGKDKGALRRIIASFATAAPELAGRLPKV